MFQLKSLFLGPDILCFEGQVAGHGNVLRHVHTFLVAPEQRKPQKPRSVLQA